MARKQTKRQKETAGIATIALCASQMSEDACANLAKLEKAARESRAFGEDLSFDDRAWVIQKKAANQREVTLWFTVHRNGKQASKQAKSREDLARTFAVFLKSVIRLAQAASPGTSPSAHEATLRAARYLHDQLVHREFDPAKLTEDDFVRAERAAGQRDKATWSQFAVSQSLHKLAGIVDKYRLSQYRINFRPRVQAPDLEQMRADVGPDPALLPSKAALDALPQISEMVTDPSDVRMMRIIELLHCAPFRIGELLSLPEDCEVVVDANGMRVSIDELGRRVGELSYGLKYKPEKNPDLTSDEKWIASNSIPMVRRALADLRKHTADARKIAAFMEDNPGRAWFPAHLLGLERLTIDDLVSTLGIPRKQTFEWLRRYKLTIRPPYVLRDELEAGLSTTLSAKAKEQDLIECVRKLLRDRSAPWFDVDTTLKSVIAVRDVYRWLRVKTIPVYHADVSRADVESVILSLNSDVAPDFPWKLSECLFVSHKPTLPMHPIIELIDQNQVRYFLTGDKNSPSIFEKFGFKEPNGDPIHVTSHAFRRWLGTLAHDRGMSGTEVKNMLGHKSERSTSKYDHRTPDALAKDIRRAFSEGLVHGPIAEIARSINQPRERDTFLETILATAHITEYGMCARDWLSNPCVRHGACGSCDKQLIRKGDPDHKQSIARMLRENRMLLARATEEVEDGQRGANNHARHLAREVAALEATMTIHDDPSIADGSYVQLDLPAIFEKIED